MFKLIWVHYRIIDIFLMCMIYIGFAVLGSSIALPSYAWSMSDVIAVDLFALFMVLEDIYLLIISVKEVEIESFNTYNPTEQYDHNSPTEQ